MSKTARKQARREAVRQETIRWWQQAERECPLTRAQLDRLLDWLSERIVADGHDLNLALTEAWLAGQGIDPAPTLDFLRSRKMRTDFDVVLDADPNKLFGPSRDRLARMPLSQQELCDLIEWLDRACRARGCDRSLRMTREWLRQRQLPLAPTELALVAQAGNCDCMVLLNVRPEMIYPGDAA